MHMAVSLLLVAACLGQASAPDEVVRTAEQEMAQRPLEALAIARQASGNLSDRADLQRRLFATTVRVLEPRLGDLSEKQATELVEAIRQHLADRATLERVQRRWITERRDRLPADDAVGRLQLARVARRWLPEREPAVGLLREALHIAPQTLAKQLTADDLDALGSPRHVSRQILYRRYLEQRSYDHPMPLWIELECVKGQEPRVVTVLLLKTVKP